jgi:hypothetical protein
MCAGSFCQSLSLMHTIVLQVAVGALTDSCRVSIGSHSREFASCMPALTALHVMRGGLQLMLHGISCIMASGRRLVGEFERMEAMMAEVQSVLRQAQEAQGLLLQFETLSTRRSVRPCTRESTSMRVQLRMAPYAGVLPCSAHSCIA